MSRARPSCSTTPTWQPTTTPTVSHTTRLTLPPTVSALRTASPLSLSSFQLRSAPLTLPPLSLPPFQLWPALLQHSAVPIVVRAGQIGNLSAVYQKRLPNAKIGANFMGIMGADCPEVNAVGCNFK